MFFLSHGYSAAEAAGLIFLLCFRLSTCNRTEPALGAGLGSRFAMSHCLNPVAGGQLQDRKGQSSLFATVMQILLHRLGQV